MKEKENKVNNYGSATFYFNYKLSEAGKEKVFVTTGLVATTEQTVTYRAASLTEAERLSAIWTGAKVKTSINATLKGEWDKPPATFANCLFAIEEWR